MWTVQDAKAQLSEVLRRARAGDPQVIGTRDPCVVVSLADYEKRRAETPFHLGQFLLDNPPPFELDLPPRAASSRPVPFETEE